MSKKSSQWKHEEISRQVFQISRQYWNCEKSVPIFRRGFHQKLIFSEPVWNLVKARKQKVRNLIRCIGVHKLRNEIL